MKNKRLLPIITTIILLFSSISVYSQYHWPLKLQPELTSRFCDYRSGHFHAGFDFRTNGKPGYRIYAIDDGHIFRLSTSFTGYGKALYLKLDSGPIVVYGHLSSFGKNLDEFVRIKQLKDKKYKQNIIFNVNEYQVRKGDVLGLSGSSGSGAPHLHFELRSSDNNPINPASSGFKIDDNTAPVFENIAIRHYKNGFNFVNPCDLEFPEIIRDEVSGQYQVQDTIFSDDYIALAVAGGDRIDGKGFIYGYNELKLFIDDTHVFSMINDSLSYSTTDQLDYIRDFELNATIGMIGKKDNDQGIFYRLYVPPGADQFFWPDFGSYSGIISPDYSPGNVRNIVIEAIDEAGNKSTLSLVAKTPELKQPSPEFISYYNFEDTLEVDFLTFEETSGVIVQSRDRYSYKFQTVETQFLSEIWQSNKKTAHLNSFRFVAVENIREYRYMFYDQNGSSGWIYFYDGKYFQGIDILGSPKHLKINYYPESAYSIVAISLKSDNYFKSMRMIQNGPGAYTVDIFDTTFAGDFTININGDDSICVDTVIKFNPVFENEKTKILSPESIVTLDFENNSLFSSAYIFFSGPLNNLVRGRDAKVFEIDPIYLIANDKIKFRIDLKRLGSISQNTGLYGYAPRSARWRFIAPSNSDILEFNGGGLGKLAFIEDSAPPKVTTLRPKGRIKSRQPNLTCKISDDLSGVDTGGRLKMEIDGIWVPAEFDNDTSRFAYKVKNNLRFGKHTLKITAYDRQGNKKISTRVFTIVR